MLHLPGTVDVRDYQLPLVVTFWVWDWFAYVSEEEEEGVEVDEGFPDISGIPFMNKREENVKKQKYLKKYFD